MGLASIASVASHGSIVGQFFLLQISLIIDHSSSVIIDVKGYSPIRVFDIRRSDYLIGQ